MYLYSGCTQVHTDVYEASALNGKSTLFPPRFNTEMVGFFDPSRRLSTLREDAFRRLHQAWWTHHLAPNTIIIKLLSDLDMAVFA